jgi:hypothetical protein
MSLWVDRIPTIDELHTPRPMSEWHEDTGSVLWHHLPICEPPYCGTPLDSRFDDYPEGWLTHWTPLPNCNEIQRRFDRSRSEA